ncbi:MAG TPA: response regulator transcription factor [Mycobacteriales bacterium]|nr:response regulator transcription factor [Mycobacteriales bacterium]
MTVRVVVAEDQALVRAGLVTILRTDPQIDVVADVADGEQAIEAVLRERPDVALLDVRMPVLDGLAATRRICAETEAKVLVLTTFGEDAVVFEALRSGALGFLLKDTRPEDLLAAVHAVADGESRLDPTVTSAVVGHFRRQGGRSGAEASTYAATAVQQLTAREREVLILIARGLSNAEIGAELVLSPGTVKTHVGSVLSKLGVRDRVQAVIAAYESGLVQP